MRISDWSSDVCSSDLKADSAVFPHWGFCRCFHDYLFIHHAAVPLYQNALSPSRQMTGVRNSPLNLKSHVGAAETASAAPQRPSAPRLQAWSLPPAGACRIRSQYPPRRSEEHTSELQSLMRISY